MSIEASKPLRQEMVQPSPSNESGKRSRFSTQRIGYLYIFLPIALYFLFVVLPFGHAIVLSFQKWDGLTTAEWVGFANYVDIVADEDLKNAFIHTVILLAFFSLFPIIVGLFLAAIMSRFELRGLTVFRSLLFLPQVIAAIVIGITWRWIYNPDGMLNRSLEAVGLGDLTRAWLGDFTFALPAIGFVGTWVMFGFTMMLFLAGIQKVPRSLYDAARVDGAGPIQEFFAVTLPNLRREIVVVTVITSLAAFRVFDIVFVTTRGGPGTATAVPAIELYERGFLQGRVGSAAAIGVVLAAISLVVTFIVVRIGERGEE